MCDFSLQFSASEEVLCWMACALFLPRSGELYPLVAFHRPRLMKAGARTYGLPNQHLTDSITSQRNAQDYIGTSLRGFVDRLNCCCYSYTLVAALKVDLRISWSSLLLHAQCCAMLCLMHCNILNTVCWLSVLVLVCFQGLGGKVHHCWGPTRRDQRMMPHVAVLRMRPTTGSSEYRFVQGTCTSAKKASAS